MLALDKGSVVVVGSGDGSGRSYGVVRLSYFVQRFNTRERTYPEVEDVRVGREQCIWALCLGCWRWSY